MRSVLFVLLLLLVSRIALAQDLLEAVDKGDFARVKQLVADGADVNQRDWQETTPLLKASRKGNMDISCFLIEQGADIHALDSQGNSPLLFACKLKLLDMVQYLIENGASVDVRNKYGHSAILNACWLIGGRDSTRLSNVQRIINLLVTIPEIKRRQYEIVKLLVVNGAKVNDRIIPHDYTPLTMACANDNIELIKYLIAHKAKINVTDGVGFRMMCWACANHGDDTELIRYLLKNGAKADTDCVLNPDYEYTPLMNACRKGADLQVIELLIRYGAKINAKDQTGRTALSIAIERGDTRLTDYLRAKGAKE